MSTNAPEHDDSLWYLPAAPLVWAAHFLLCYATAAVWCAKLVSRDGSLLPVQIAIAAYTTVSLIAVAWLGWRGFKRHRERRPAPHDADTPEDRRAFLGFASLLLAGLSAIAIVYEALPALLIRSCQ